MTTQSDANKNQSNSLGNEGIWHDIIFARFSEDSFLVSVDKFDILGGRSLIAVYHSFRKQL
jgi:hypothetical protein